MQIQLLKFKLKQYLLNQNNDIAVTFLFSILFPFIKGNNVFSNN